MDVDDSPLTRFDRRVESGKRRLAAFASVAATAFSTAAYGAYRMVDAASDADESLNVLSRTFGAQTDEVLAWSKVMGETMGRSMYDLQDSAGKFGAFLEPQFKGRTEEIVTMSQKLTALSVDLASFYNTSDQEASMRLFSGLSGETEAVRRLGVDISDTSLDAFNKKTGDDKTKNKRMAALSLQEKTLLRYRKILADTVGKQNDAALTANSWANQVKKLQADMKDLAVTLGRALMPYAKQLLKVGRFLVDTFKVLTVKTDGLRDAFLALTYVGVASALWMIGKAIYGAGLIGGFVQLTAAGTGFLKVSGGLIAVAGVFAIFEDAFSFLQGKETIIGNMIKNVYGLHKPLQAVTDLAEDYAGHLMNALAASRALANPTLVAAGMVAGMTLLDVLGKFGYQNIAENRRKREKGRADTASASASTTGGKFDWANYPDMSRKAAVEKWRDDHAAAIDAGKIPATASDVAQGMADEVPLTAPQAPKAAAPVAWKSMVPGNFQVVPDVHITVNGAADPIATGLATTAAWKQEQRKLRRANARTQGAGE